MHTQSCGSILIWKSGNTSWFSCFSNNCYRNRCFFLFSFHFFLILFTLFWVSPVFSFERPKKTSDNICGFFTNIIGRGKRWKYHDKWWEWWRMAEEIKKGNGWFSKEKNKRKEFVHKWTKNKNPVGTTDFINFKNFWQKKRTFSQC